MGLFGSCLGVLCSCGFWVLSCLFVFFSSFWHSLVYFLYTRVAPLCAFDNEILLIQKKKILFYHLVHILNPFNLSCCEHRGLVLSFVGLFLLS
jgi:hypothetical protein